MLRAYTHYVMTVRQFEERPYVLPTSTEEDNVFTNPDPHPLPNSQGSAPDQSFLKAVL